MVARSDDGEVAPLPLKLSPADAQRLRGRWIGVDAVGAALVSGRTLGEALDAARSLGRSDLEFFAVPAFAVVG